MKIKIFTVIILLLSLTSNTFRAQSEKVPLSFEAIRQWRSHSVALSDNGKWYTTNYRLSDKPEGEKDSIIEKKYTKFLDDNNQTDVLYISHERDGIKYKIPNATRPLFSSSSEWIAYQIQPESDKKTKGKTKDPKTIIELKHLTSGFTVSYESNAKYEFLEDKDYFITSNKNSLLIYDLINRREHYIGNIGEYLIDKKSDYIIYTIASDDNRGNGIYAFNPKEMTTRALETSSSLYSNLSWNPDKNVLATYKYKEVNDKADYLNMQIIVLSEIDSKSIKYDKYIVKDINGMPEYMGPAIKSGRYKNEINWSKNNNLLFLKIKAYDKKEKTKKDSSKVENKSNVQIWHWKDKKLLSERITEHERKKNKVFEAIFIRNTNTLIRLTGEDLQDLTFSKGTDQWAVGTDNRKYISDWDVKRNDLYSLNLNTGQKKLIKENHSSSFYSNGYYISPEGEGLMYWDGQDYIYYNFEKDSKQNITDKLNISFVNEDYDKFGYSAQYGFVGWTKDRNAVIVNHKLDLWYLPFTSKAKAKNLTAKVTSKDSIRLRFENTNFEYETKLEDRYIDLSSQILLYAFNTQNKYTGYFKLQNDKLTELIYKPAVFSSNRRRNQLITSKNSDAIIYKEGDYQNYPEAYLSDLNFSKSKKITNTNPLQKQFKWGKRILIDYTNDDGVPLQGILSIPEGYTKGKKLPMIVYSYEKHSYEMYRYASPYLSGTSIPEMLYVSNGYLFLQPDIHFNVGTPHSDMHECIDAAVTNVIELGYVNEEKIGYQGYSFGGHTGMYVSTQNNKFTAIAAGGGVSNLVQGFNLDIVWDGSNEQDYYMTGQGRLGTDPTSNTDMYISESPVFNAKNMNTPLLLYAGTEDNIVQWEHSFGFYSILRYLKKPVVFLSYRGEGHGLRNKESTRLDIQKRLKEYFDYYLKDGESKKWMLEETKYEPKAKSEDNTSKKTTPNWK